MKNYLIAASAFALLSAASVAGAQDPTPMTGMMSSSDIGASPMTGTSATDYVKMAADSKNYEIQSSRLALMRIKSAAVKSLCKADDRRSHADHQIADGHAIQRRRQDHASLDYVVDRQYVEDTAAEEGAARELQQPVRSAAVQAHQAAWSLHKGHATDGTDPALKQVASTAVPVIEMHIQHLKAIMPAGMSGM